MAVRGTIIRRIATPKPRGTSTADRKQAARDFAEQLQKHIERHSSRPYPPASRPGQYPRVRSGQHLNGVNVTGTEKYITVASTAPHSLYLNEGTRNMSSRPFADKAIEALDAKENIRKKAKKNKEKRLNR